MSVPGLEGVNYTIPLIERGQQQAASARAAPAAPANCLPTENINMN